MPRGFKLEAHVIAMNVAPRRVIWLRVVRISVSQRRSTHHRLQFDHTQIELRVALISVRDH